MVVNENPMPSLGVSGHLSSTTGEIITLDAEKSISMAMLMCSQGQRAPIGPHGEVRGPVLCKWLHRFAVAIVRTTSPAPLLAVAIFVCNLGDPILWLGKDKRGGMAMLNETSRARDDSKTPVLHHQASRDDQKGT